MYVSSHSLRVIALKQIFTKFFTAGKDQAPPAECQCSSPGADPEVEEGGGGTQI